MSSNAGKINVYTCAKGHKTITVDAEFGTTAFGIRCRHPRCTAMAQSAFYQVDQALKPAFEWYRPSPREARKLDDATLDHVLRGGLLVRKITDLGRRAVVQRTLSKSPEIATHEAIDAFQAAHNAMPALIAAAEERDRLRRVADDAQSLVDAYEAYMRDDKSKSMAGAGQLLFMCLRQSLEALNAADATLRAHAGAPEGGRGRMTSAERDKVRQAIRALNEDAGDGWDRGMEILTELAGLPKSPERLAIDRAEVVPITTILREGPFGYRVNPNPPPDGPPPISQTKAKRRRR